MMPVQAAWCASAITSTTAIAAPGWLDTDEGREEGRTSRQQQYCSSSPEGMRKERSTRWISTSLRLPEHLTVSIRERNIHSKTQNSKLTRSIIPHRGFQPPPTPPTPPTPSPSSQTTSQTDNLVPPAFHLLNFEGPRSMHAQPAYITLHSLSKPRNPIHSGASTYPSLTDFHWVGPNALQRDAEMAPPSRYGWVKE